MKSFLRKFLRGLVFAKPQSLWRLIGLVFGLGFGAGGVAIGSLWLSSTKDYLRSCTWEQVDAQVFKSEVATSESGDSWQVKVAYAYRFQGRNLEGDRFDFGSDSTNIGKTKMEEAAASYPTGSSVMIWVNPEEPEESVLVRKLSYQVWVDLAGSVPFLLVGICGFGYFLLSGRIWEKSRELRGDLMKSAPARIREAMGAEQLDWDQRLIFTEAARKYEGLGFLAAALFWNGIVLVFLIGMVEMLSSGDGLGYFLALFLIPFVLIGGWLFRMSLRSLFGKEPPAWVIWIDGVELGSNGDQGGHVTLAWMPLDDGTPFRECFLGVKRWKPMTSYNKWAKENPRWQRETGSLHEMQAGEVGQTVVTMDRLVSQSRWSRPQYCLNLVMTWKGEDGRDEAASFLLATPNSDND